MVLTWAKELQCNFVRLAHYPHREHMVRAAEEMGLMVWSEIPVYWTIDWENPDTLQNALNQLTENIGRDKNRACVIVWSVANETPPGEARNRFLKTLARRARELDPSRLVSAAMEKHYAKEDPGIAVVEDPFADECDIVSFNQYIGWYDGLPEKCDRVTWKIGYDKPVIVSEFGGDALGGLHGEPGARWTEEFQKDLYERTLRMLRDIPQLRGLTPWILADFRSPRRLLPHVQDGWNRKGLVSQQGKRKLAFEVVKAFYESLA
jgi:beta-glucuronidase